MVSYNKKYGIGLLKKHIFNEPIEEYRRYDLIMAKGDKSWRLKRNGKNKESYILPFQTTFFFGSQQSRPCTTSFLEDLMLCIVKGYHP